MAEWKVHTGRGVDDHRGRGHEREEEGGRGEDGSRAPMTPDHGCGEDSADALSGLVNSPSSTYWMSTLLVDDRPDGSDNTPCTPCGAVCRPEQVRGDGRNGAADEFEIQLVAHYTHNIYSTEKWIAEFHLENGEDMNAYMLRHSFQRKGGTGTPPPVWRTQEVRLESNLDFRGRVGWQL